MRIVKKSLNHSFFSAAAVRSTAWACQLRFRDFDTIRMNPWIWICVPRFILHHDCFRSINFYKIRNSPVCNGVEMPAECCFYRCLLKFSFSGGIRGSLCKKTPVIFFVFWMPSYISNKKYPVQKISKTIFLDWEVLLHFEVPKLPISLFFLLNCLRLYCAVHCYNVYLTC